MGESESANPSKSSSKFTNGSNDERRTATIGETKGIKMGQNVRQLENPTEEPHVVPGKYERSPKPLVVGQKRTKRRQAEAKFLTTH